MQKLGGESKMRDLLRYDFMTQEAMRGVVRKALKHVECEGLPGEHHFFITFATNYPGVEISDVLLGRYPSEMTIVLQHQYWGLEVSDDSFCVSLTFNKIPERLVIPFRAIKGFFDPSVQFGLQFPIDGEIANQQIPEATDGMSEASTDILEDEGPAEVVSLDSFRKKS